LGFARHAGVRAGGRDLEKSKSELQEKILDLEKFEEVVVGRELKMIALEKELESVQKPRRPETRERLSAMPGQPRWPIQRDRWGPSSDSAAHVELLERRLRKRDEQRRAMLHILVDYEQDRRRLARQTERLEQLAPGRACISCRTRTRTRYVWRLAARPMIHIMGNLRETTAEVQRREQELRDKQERSCRRGSSPRSASSPPGVAHELNNPLNNIGLFVGNAVDLVELAVTDKGEILGELRHAIQQVSKATQIISPCVPSGGRPQSGREPISLREVIERALSLMGEQLRLREIAVTVDLGPQEPVVVGNAIQLEQVFINLLTNARDAVAESPRKEIHISAAAGSGAVDVALADTGPGFRRARAADLRSVLRPPRKSGRARLGLSITYGIIREHGGTISVASPPGEGATFLIHLPLAPADTPETSM